MKLGKGLGKMGEESFGDDEENLEKLKKGLMQKLLTGELRVNVE